MTAQTGKRSKRTKIRDWERRLGPYLDWMTYLACAGLIVLVVWLATSRPQARVSFTGTSSHVQCDLAPVPAVSGEGEPIEYPHLHASADALIVTGTTLRFASEPLAQSGEEISVPKSPQATAVIKFDSHYTVRLFMHKGNKLGLLPGSDLEFASAKPWAALGMPDEYTIAFQFHYQPDTLLWRVVGIEEAGLTVMTSGFDRDRSFTKPRGKRLEISGFAHPFQNVPIAFGCCSSEWPPLIGQLATLGPGGQTVSYVPMLFVTVQTTPDAELVEAEPLMCEQVSVEGAVGALSLSGNSQSLDTPVSLSFNGHLEVRPTSDRRAIKYTIPGGANSLILGGHELIPTRLEAIGAFWAGLLGTVAGAFVIGLIVTKGRMIQNWLQE